MVNGYQPVLSGLARAIGRSATGTHASIGGDAELQPSDRTPTLTRQSAWATLYRHPGRHLTPELGHVLVGPVGQIGERHAEVWNERLRRRVTLACDHNAGRAWTVAARSAATVHPHRKVERDTAIRREAFENRWQAIEYIVVSPRLREDVRSVGFALIPPALEHGETEAQFDSGGWPLEVRRVRP